MMTAGVLVALLLALVTVVLLAMRWVRAEIARHSASALTSDDVVTLIRAHGMAAPVGAIPLEAERTLEGHEGDDPPGESVTDGASLAGQMLEDPRVVDAPSVQELSAQDAAQDFEVTDPPEDSQSEDGDEAADDKETPASVEAQEDVKEPVEKWTESTRTSRTSRRRAAAA